MPAEHWRTPQAGSRSGTCDTSDTTVKGAGKNGRNSKNSKHWQQTRHRDGKSFISEYLGAAPAGFQSQATEQVLPDEYYDGSEKIDIKIRRIKLNLSSAHTLKDELEKTKYIDYYMVWYTYGFW